MCRLRLFFLLRWHGIEEKLYNCTASLVGELSDSLVPRRCRAISEPVINSLVKRVSCNPLQVNTFTHLLVFRNLTFVLLRILEKPFFVNTSKVVVSRICFLGLSERYDMRPQENALRRTCPRRWGHSGVSAASKVSKVGRRW